MRTALLFAPLMLVACTSAKDATEDELNDRLAGQSLLVLDCPAPCPAGAVCGSEAVDRLSRDVGRQPVVIAAVSNSFVGRSRSYYFVDGQGAGTRYYELVSDTRPCDDCGWHKTPFRRLQVEEEVAAQNFSGGVGATGRLTLVADGESARYSIGPSDCS